MTPDVSVLIVSWNTRELTLRCLDSLPASVDDGTSFETIVVDNASRDGTAEALGGRGDALVVANRENRGFAGGVNQAYALSRGELVLLLNSDVELAPGSLSTLARFLRAHPRAAGVGPLYLDPDGSPQPFHYRFPTLPAMLASASGPLRRLPPLARSVRRYGMLDDDFAAARAVPQPSASCLLLRRSCLPPDRLLDERYPVYFNDVALARQLAAAGFELWVTPAATVRHVHGASTRLLGRRLARQHIGAFVRYLRAWEPRYKLACFRAVVLVQKLAAWTLRRGDALPPRELLAALRGDPGPLPQAPE
ncbi:MAG TPA: glycosyltransferase family 2 protein [Gaiellaceae bacterium]|nr:glycosyltransferase family 2 protein [Gaiellaceae bacterium]